MSLSITRELYRNFLQLKSACKVGSERVDQLIQKMSSWQPVPSPNKGGGFGSRVSNPPPVKLSVA